MCVYIYIYYHNDIYIYIHVHTYVYMLIHNVVCLAPSMGAEARSDSIRSDLIIVSSSSSIIITIEPFYFEVRPALDVSEN